LTEQSVKRIEDIKEDRRHQTRERQTDYEVFLFGEFNPKESSRELILSISVCIFCCAEISPTSPISTIFFASIIPRSIGLSVCSAHFLYKLIRRANRSNISLWSFAASNSFNILLSLVASVSKMCNSFIICCSHNLNFSYPTIRRLCFLPSEQAPENLPSYRAGCA